MEVIHGEGAGHELFEAQSHLYKHICSFMNSMALKSAVELGIPDIIHNHHPHPTTLPQLVSALHIPHSKTSCVRRLMRLLVHSGFFSITKVLHREPEEEEEGYILTPSSSSRLLLKDNPNPNLSPFVLTLLHPVLVTPWHFFGDWLRGNGLTAFETAHGESFWDHGSHNPEFSNLFNEALASDSQMMGLVHAGDLKPVFEGLSSLVDVGGGTGLLARIISEAFPQLKCTVLDLPHVVANLPAESSNLVFVEGDMFHSIPSADAILLKCVLHDWSDGDCVKILKKCREAIPSEEEGGKVIIMDIVINEMKDEADITETKLLMDMLMMTLVNGGERDEKEWEKLFLEAGFKRYKITPLFGLRSLIEVFP